MSKTNKFSPEVRERAVRLVQEHRGEYSSLWAATQSIAPKIGCSAHTLLKWVQLQEVEAGTRSGVPQAEQERIKALERENKELRRANEILKSASVHSTGHCNTWFILTINGGVYEKKNQTQIHRDGVSPMLGTMAFRVGLQ